MPARPAWSGVLVERVPGAGARIRAAREQQGDGRRLAEVGREVERRPAVAGVRGDEPRRAAEESGERG